MSGYLNNKTVYLCGPLGLVHDDGKGWREELTPHLEKLGLIVSDPTKSTAQGIGEVGDDKKKFRELIQNEEWLELKKEFWPIVRKDLRAVDKADFIIVNYVHDALTIGTWHECVVANLAKKPILLKYDRENLDTFNPWVVTFVKDNEIFHSWDDMIRYLTDEIDSGQYNSSQWTL